jgi:hypothetical protein
VLGRRVSSSDLGAVVGVVAVALVLGIAAPAGLGAANPAKKKLPPGALRGPIDRLRQYPTLSLATVEQRAAAKELWEATRAGSSAWADPKVAAAAGFRVRRARRQPGDRSPHWLHAEHHRYSNDELFLDPHHPEVIIYANVPGRPLMLIGVMYGVKPGMRGPTPGGPITRWHTHWICARGNHRGFAPRPDGSCPRGTHGRQARNEMLHVWFTHDLRSAYAINPPQPELCVAQLLPAGYCHHLQHGAHHSH